eukprot:6721890-Prorocentrum_lima.AAC.1
MSTPEHLGPQDQGEKLKFIGVMIARVDPGAIQFIIGLHGVEPPRGSLNRSPRTRRHNMEL